MIIKQLDGTYRIEVQIQDGTERAYARTEEDARRKWRDIRRLMGGDRKCKKSDAPLFEEIQVVRTELRRLS